ncbi:MAG: DNA pilot protein [Microviridae sp.]|nr:MAG: DNA pilot protein [Microviridae sp.]
MGPAALAAIPGIVTGVGDFISGKSNAKAARDAFKSRYQDTVADMKKAGLNPSLAYGQGGGNPQTHDLPNIGESIARGAQAFSSAKQSNQQAELVASQKKLLDAQSEDLATGTRLKNALLLSQVHATGAQAGLTMMQQDALQQSMRRNELDISFQAATLEERIKRVSVDLQRAGVDIDRAKIEAYLRSLETNAAQAESQFWEGAGAGQTSLKAILELLRILK